MDLLRTLEGVRGGLGEPVGAMSEGLIPPSLSLSGVGMRILDGKEVEQPLVLDSDSRPSYVTGSTHVILVPLFTLKNLEETTI